MIILELSENKALTRAKGSIFPGEKGVTGRLAIPTNLDGVAVSGTGWAGNVYIKYGSGANVAYEAISLSGTTGNQDFDISDTTIAAATTLVIWAEFTKTVEGSVTDTVITRECSIVIPSHETYVAPDAGDD